MLSKLMTVISSNISILCLIISTLISLSTSLFDFSKVSFSYILNRHNLLIFPLFECLDPYLYYKVDKDNIDENDIRKAIQIIDNNKNLASGKLIAFSYYLNHDFPETEKLKHFYNLCSYVDLQYDFSCIRLHLSRRPHAYRKCRSYGHPLGFSRFIRWLISYFIIIFLYFFSLLGLSKLAQKVIDAFSYKFGIFFLLFIFIYSIFGTYFITRYGKE